MKKFIKLKLQKTIKIKPIKPFDFNSTFHKPDHFESDDNFWKENVKWQTFNWKKIPLGLKFINKGTKTAPLIELKIYSKNKLKKEYLNSLIEEIKYRYNLNLDLKDFYKKFKNHKLLGLIIKKWKGMRPAHSNSLYEYLIIGIVLQNASVKRSIQMFRKLLENYGKVLEFDNKKLLCFWNEGELENITEEDLRKLKVGYRAKSIKKIDDYFRNNLIDEIELRGKDREYQMKELLKLYGVGPATVWYLLFDVFHHFDFFNHISPWEQKIYSKLFFNQNPENPVEVDKILKYFNQFKEYKQLAVHYIWEDLWWKRKNKNIPWLEKEIRV
jgi:3-methyladenine DNA glycosylase/8-oxoguanine DNA glycosylase